MSVTRLVSPGFRFIFGEALQLLDWPWNAGVGVADVQFRDFRRCTLTRVFHIERNRDRLVQVSRLRQSPTTCCTRRWCRKDRNRRRIAASFQIDQSAGTRRKCLPNTELAYSAIFRVVAVKRRIVFPTTLKGCRQLARRTVIAKENLRQCRPALLPGIPGVQNGRNIVNPSRHVDVAAGGQHDDHVLVDCADLPNEFVLSARKLERFGRNPPLPSWDRIPRR